MELAYRRTDYFMARRALMQQWADFISPSTQLWSTQSHSPSQREQNKLISTIKCLYTCLLVMLAQQLICAGGAGLFLSTHSNKKVPCNDYTCEVSIVARSELTGYANWIRNLRCAP